MDWKLTFRVLFTAAALAGVAVSGRTSLGVEPAESVSVALRSFNKAAEADGSAIVDRGRHFLGVGSCSASNCHGGDGTRGAVGSEYSIWIQDDKHAEAFSVLYNETSQRMARLLKLDKPAHQAVLCLNCHAPQNDPPFVRASSHETLSALLDGVSCEACHGAASDWLGPHVRRSSIPTDAAAFCQRFLSVAGFGTIPTPLSVRLSSIFIKRLSCLSRIELNKPSL